jgi:hypothetical protein
MNSAPKPTIDLIIKRIIYVVENKKEMVHPERFIENEIRWYINSGDTSEIEKRFKKRTADEDKQIRRMQREQKT